MNITPQIIYDCRNNQKLLEEVLYEFKPLVTAIARRYFLTGAEPDDLVQEGMIGLYKAIQTYDESKQASFKTFASICINSQIQSAVKKQNNSKNKVYF